MLYGPPLSNRTRSTGRLRAQDDKGTRKHLEAIANRYLPQDVPRKKPTIRQ
jgi:hypothetical protein